MQHPVCPGFEVQWSVWRHLARFVRRTACSNIAATRLRFNTTLESCTRFFPYLCPFAPVVPVFDRMAGLKPVFISLVVALICCWRWTRGADHDKHMFTSYANLLKLYYMEGEGLSNVDVFLREELTKHGDQDAADAAHNLTSIRR